MRLRLALGFVLLATPALAVLPNEQLSDPKLEARARAISTQLRCVVCQNQTIDDSDAELAHDLRVLLRQRLKAGDSDQQAIAFIANRYGDYVLLKPPFDAETLLLWLAAWAWAFISSGDATATRRHSPRKNKRGCKSC
jgi:cytochrome c-type biogenesis protein CcmH